MSQETKDTKTVGELIAKLQGFPPETRVCVFTHRDGDDVCAHNIGLVHNEWHMSDPMDCVAIEIDLNAQAAPEDI